MIRILETVLYVNDLEKAEHFYVSVLGFSILTRRAGRHLFLRAAHSLLLLFNAKATSKPEADSEIPAHGARGSGHVGFEIEENDIAYWMHRLERHGVPVEKTLRWENGATSLYFRDPSGNLLEFLTRDLWNIDAPG